MADDDLRRLGDDDLERQVRGGDAWAALAWTRMRSASAPGRLFARFPPWARWTYMILATMVIVAAAIAAIVVTS